MCPPWTQVGEDEVGGYVHPTAQRILEGDVRSAGRLMRAIDDRDKAVIPILRVLYEETGGAHVVGITGSPGVGKSTLVDALITEWRGRGVRVGVVAVDPTSPFSGGAILGDRVRMQRHANDPGVFIRSVASRGALGGLSPSVDEMVCVLDAMGHHVILIETVGVGQGEVDVARAAHTTVVVVAPGMGDDVQAIKAGLLEIGDVLVVNKGDRPGAKREMRFLQTMVHSAPVAANGWSPLVLTTTAMSGDGVGAVVDAAQQHHEHMSGRGLLEERRAAQVREEALRLAHERIDERLRSALESIPVHSSEPYSLADELVTAVVGSER